MTDESRSGFDPTINKPVEAVVSGAPETAVENAPDPFAEYEEVIKRKVEADPNRLPVMWDRDVPNAIALHVISSSTDSAYIHQEAANLIRLLGSQNAAVDREIAIYQSGTPHRDATAVLIANLRERIAYVSGMRRALERINSSPSSTPTTQECYRQLTLKTSMNEYSWGEGDVKLCKAAIGYLENYAKRTPFKDDDEW